MGAGRGKLPKLQDMETEKKIKLKSKLMRQNNSTCRISDN